MKIYTINELKNILNKFDDQAKVFIIYKNKNKMQYIENFEIYNRQELINNTLIKDKNIVFIDMLEDIQ